MRVDGRIVESMGSQQKSQNLENVARTTIDRLAVGLQSDFTQESVSSFIPSVRKILVSMPEQSMRESLFLYFNDRCVWNVVLPKQVEIEDLKDFSPESLKRAKHTLAVACSLVEHAWKLSVDPLVDNPIAIKEYELGRIRYAKKETERLMKLGQCDLANCHHEFAKSLEKLVDDPHGPVALSFQSFCRRVDHAPVDRRGEPDKVQESRLKSKIGLLEQVNKYVGHYPQWAKEWLSKTESENAAKR